MSREDTALAARPGPKAKGGRVSGYERFDRQLEDATRSDGSIDVALLRHLVGSAYERASIEPNHRLLLMALENMTQGLCLYDAQDRLLFANRRLEQLIEVPGGSIREGMSFRDMVEVELRAELFPRRPVEEILSERRALIDAPNDEGRILEFSHHGRHLAATYHRIPDGGWIKTITDVTAERRAEAQAAGNARLASLGEMAAGLAHELRQPLAAAVLAATNGIRALDRSAVDRARLKLDVCIGQCMRASELIEHLRRFARGWDAEVALEPVPLDAPVAGALTLLRGMLREAGVAVTQDIGSPPPVILGHPIAVEQILVNLISNAVDAFRVRPGAGEGRISLRAVRRGQAVTLSVSDTAGGIADNVMAHLFEPFVTTKGPSSGTGLGLSICHGLMRTLGGSIAAVNTSGGAEFTLRFRSAEA